MSSGYERYINKVIIIIIIIIIINRFSRVPAVFTFLQAVEAPTPDLSPISL